MKIRFFLSVALAAGLFIFSFSSAGAQSVAGEKAQTITFKVSGIDCPVDVKIIKDTLQQQKGVSAIQSVSKAAPTTTFQITYDPSVITLDHIYQIVENSPDCDDRNARPYKVKNKK